MKKRTMGVFTLLIIILGSCATLAVATPITDLGTMNYADGYEFVSYSNINGSEEVDLIFLASELNESALDVYNNGFYPSESKTLYKFTAKRIYPEFWFVPEIKSFLYMDNNTGNIYRLNVNYSKADIPENPYEKRHRQLVENYTIMMNNYNLTNETLANITLQFNGLNDTYNQKMQQFNTTMAENHNLSENMTNLTAAFNNLDDEYNTTYAMWESAVNSSVYYETGYNDKVKDYNQLEKDHNSLAGAVPWYIIIGILGTFLFTYIYVRRKNIFDAPSDTTDEITTGYGKIHSSIDRHILSRFRKEPKTDEGKIEEINKWKEAPKEDFTPDEKEKIQRSIDDAKEGRITPLNIEKQDDVLATIHGKIDANNRATNIKIDANAREISTKIDRLFEGIDERINRLSKETKA